MKTEPSAPVQVALALLVLAASACSSVGGEALPAALRSEAFCVERREADGRDLASQIAEALRARGLDARSAPDVQCRGAAPFRVTYVDNWSWDLRMFLTRLTIEVVDDENGESVAFGESFQDTFVALGKTHKDVIDRAVSALLESK